MDLVRQLEGSWFEAIQNTFIPVGGLDERTNAVADEENELQDRFDGNMMMILQKILKMKSIHDKKQ